MRSYPLDTYRLLYFDMKCSSQILSFCATLPCNATAKMSATLISLRSSATDTACGQVQAFCFLSTLTLFCPLYDEIHTNNVVHWTADEEFITLSFLQERKPEHHYNILILHHHLKEVGVLLSLHLTEWHGSTCTASDTSYLECIKSLQFNRVPMSLISITDI
jgi:hypothetical protein